jgi:transcriptional regulator with XRE-family HTH domain
MDGERDRAANPRRVAWHLRRVRRELGHTRRGAAAVLGVSPLRLWRWEHGAGITSEQIEEAARAYGLEREELLPERAPVQVDLDARVIRVADVEITLQSDASEEVMSTYLRVIQTLRGSRRGTLMALRDDDLEILAEVLGDDPDQIEERLMEIMGISRAEAVALRRKLLKRRVLAPAAGMAVGVTLVAAPGQQTAERAEPPPPPPAEEPPVVTEQPEPEVADPPLTPSARDSWTAPVQVAVEEVAVEQEAASPPPAALPAQPAPAPAATEPTPVSEPEPEPEPEPDTRPPPVQPGPLYVEWPEETAEAEPDGPAAEEDRVFSEDGEGDGGEPEATEQESQADGAAPDPHAEPDQG